MYFRTPLTPLRLLSNPSFQLHGIGMVAAWTAGSQQLRCFQGASKVPETTSKTEKSETSVENGNEDSTMLSEDKDFLYKLWMHLQL